MKNIAAVSSRNNFRLPEMVINIIRDEKRKIIVALTYIAVEILNVKRTIEKIVNYSRPERRIISLKEIIILYLYKFPV